MAQMLLEQPIREANRIGYTVQGYTGLEERLHEIREQIRPVMQNIVTRYEDDPTLRGVILNGLPAEGSYHRGSLISIASESMGGQRDIPLSASGELFYWATAWLDDIADKNTFRQSSQSVRTQIDDNIAMYASNALYGIVLETIAEQFETEPAKLAKILKYFAHNFHVINRGQAKDMFMAKMPIEEVSVSDYVNLIKETTGVDVATNLAIGCVSGGLNQETQNTVYQFGLRLGTLAQIRDDILDYCKAKDGEGQYVIGKLPFRDAETGKKRLPLLLTQKSDLRVIPSDVYDRVEAEFINPRREEARSYLDSANIGEKSKELLGKILEYWSDIRIFQKLSSH